MHAVLTRERGLNASLQSWLPEGVTFSEVPLSTTRYFDAENVQTTLRASEHYGEFATLVVTSARSAPYAALAREALRNGALVFSVGSATALALANEDVDVDVVGDGGAPHLAPTIREGPVLLLGATVVREELADELRARDLEVTNIACYETLPVSLSVEDERALFAADVLFIGAPSAWNVAKAHVEPSTWVVVPGTTTATIVRLDHVRVIEGWGPDLREHLRAL